MTESNSTPATPAQPEQPAQPAHLPHAGNEPQSSESHESSAARTPVVDAVTEGDREELTYELFGTAMRELAQTIIDDYQPDLILSIARGGLLIGGALGYAMGIKNVSVINVEFYTGVNERLDNPIMLPPTPDAVDLTGMKVLIADDVADTGKTLELVQQYCAETVAESRTAVIYEKPHTTINADYVWKYTDKWINFPWSTLPPVTRRGND